MDQRGVLVAPDAMLSYFVRPSISLARLRMEPNGKVSYQADHFHPKHKTDVRSFEPLEFLGLLAVHIPDPNNRLVAYSRFYSNRARGDRKKQSCHPKTLDPRCAKPPASLPGDVVPPVQIAPSDRSTASTRSSEGPCRPLSEAVGDFEREYLARALEQHRGNVLATARSLGVSRQTLYNKLQQRALIDKT